MVAVVAAARVGDWGGRQRGIVNVDAVRTMTPLEGSPIRDSITDVTDTRRTSTSVLIKRQDSTDGSLGSPAQLAWRVVRNVAMTQFAFRTIGSMKA
jgi:hypothetical protein